MSSPPPGPPGPPAASLRALFALALPMVLTRSTQAVDTFADTYMVKDLGEDAIAATATGGLNSFAPMVLAMGTVFIVQSFVAQHVGRGEREETRRYAWYGLAIALVAGIVGVALIPAIDPLLGLVGYAPDVHEQMSSYLAIRLTSVFAVIAVEALGNYYGGLGNTWMQLVASVIQMVINVAWNYVFIEGRFGAPALGVDGAAWSSVVSTWAAFVFMAVAFWRGWGGAPRRRGAVRMSVRELGRVVRFGVPNGVNWFLEFAAFQLFVNAALGELGTSTVAAFNVVIAINSVSFMPAWGIASAGAILAGQTIGAGAKDQVWSHVRLTMLCTAVWMVGVGLLYLVAPRELISAFGEEGAPVGTLVEVGTTMLILSAFWQLFDAIGMTLSETLRAAGDTTWTAGARIVLAWVVFMPVSLLWIRYGGGGAAEAMICLASYLLLLAAALAYRFRSGAWKSIELIEPKLV